MGGLGREQAATRSEAGAATRGHRRLRPTVVGQAPAAGWVPRVNGSSALTCTATYGNSAAMADTQTPENSGETGRTMPVGRQGA